jgi:hypothetical protein
MAEFSDNEFDVIGFAKSLMSEVEGIRSFRQVKDDKTGEGFQVPTESRVNAFLRLIGLPYFVSITDEKDKVEQSILQPGFGITVSSTLSEKKLADSNQKYTDPNGNTEDLNLVLQSRIEMLSEADNSMGTKDMNERIAKAMYAPIDIKANIPDDLNGTAIEFVPKIPPKNGNDTENARDVFKWLLPLIPSVSDNQSHLVMPLMNEVARPFLTDVKERTVDRDTILRKPFLEQVIRIRFLKLESSETEKQKDVERDMSGSLKSMLGESEFSAIFGNGALFAKVTILEEFIIAKFLSAIGSLAKRWVKINKDRINLLRQIRPTIVIKTGSARESIYGKRIEPSVDLDGTAEGEKLKSINKKIALDEALIAILPSDEDEKTNVKQSDTKNITPGALNSPFIDLLTYGLKKNKEVKSGLESRVEKDIKNLEKIRLEVVDLMTGEFTGLSLPDVVMVMAALFIVERNYLLDLLDKYAITDMKKDPVLKTVVQNVKPSTAKAMAAIKELEKVVIQLFLLFQKEVDVNNNRSTRSQQGVQKSVYNNKSAEKPAAPTCVVYEKET